jgi:flagellar basal body rod protein FlgG
MKSALKSTARSTKSGRFTVEKKGSVLYINGNRILDPIGKPSVESNKLRSAVKEVASRK